jgi:hypothetical protein
VEALAFQEAAGTCRQPLFLADRFSELPMRPLIFAAIAALAVSACGNNDQADNTQNVDENLSAENIVSNDVTAIDAVTADSANMAADVDYSNLMDNSLDNMVNEGSGSKPPAKAPRPRPQPAEPAANAAANAATNAD